MGFRFIGLAIGVLLLVESVSALEMDQSVFDRDVQEMRFSVTTGGAGSEQLLALQESGAGGGSEYSYKSPGKAFLLSALVPGLGQYYYGSRVKPWLFFGADVAAWALYFTWQGDGNDLEDQFEAFQRSHWSREAYSDYLLGAYGAGDDDSVNATEVSHHLPDTETGQYFEMTGKYDQFSWGWDDAVRDGMTLEQWLEPTPPPREDLRVVGAGAVPASANRLVYLDLRNDANTKFDQARAMVMVAIANRLISGFEAYFTTKSRNRSAGVSDDREFSQLSFAASLKSYNAKRDTPFLTATYKF